jgi:hypothetical protein
MLTGFVKLCASVPTRENRNNASNMFQPHVRVSIQPLPSQATQCRQFTVSVIRDQALLGPAIFPTQRASACADCLLLPASCQLGGRQNGVRTSVAPFNCGLFNAAHEGKTTIVLTSSVSCSKSLSTTFPHKTLYSLLHPAKLHAQSIVTNQQNCTTLNIFHFLPASIPVRGTR